MTDKVSLFVIKTKAGNFKSFKELQDYCEKQYEVLQTALLDNKKLQEEVSHLKELLINMVSTENKIETVIESPAEATCKFQIEKIEQTAVQRELTLDEVKKLDLLIKNKRLYEKDRKVLETKKKNKELQEYTEAEIIKIAQRAISNEPTNNGDSA
jgi:hypothetical protein